MGHADGHIRHELLANNRYDEARGNRTSAYQGRYEIRGTHIDYWDDTGFTADGTFVSDDELHHAGMILPPREVSRFGFPTETKLTGRIVQRAVTGAQ